MTETTVSLERRYNIVTDHFEMVRKDTGAVVRSWPAARRDQSRWGGFIRSALLPVDFA